MPRAWGGSLAPPFTPRRSLRRERKRATAFLARERKFRDGKSEQELNAIHQPASI